MGPKIRGADVRVIVSLRTRDPSQVVGPVIRQVPVDVFRTGIAASRQAVKCNANHARNGASFFTAILEKIQPPTSVRLAARV